MMGCNSQCLINVLVSVTHSFRIFVCLFAFSALDFITNTFLLLPENTEMNEKQSLTSESTCTWVYIITFYFVFAY